MKKIYPSIPLILIFVLTVLLPVNAIATSHPAHEAVNLWKDYDRLLKNHVTSGQKHGIDLTLVDYAGLRTDPLFTQVLAQIAHYPSDKIKTPQNRLAFYINAYNLLAMKMVVDHWPLNSIKDAGGFFRSVWSLDAGIVSGQAVTLDDIENKVLRPMHEPRIHFAIVCASVSCPNLRREAYTADRIDEQLDDQLMHFLSNPKKGMKQTLHKMTISPIFAWFEEDFALHGGVIDFIHRHRTDVASVQHIEHFPYDWSVNANTH